MEILRIENKAGKAKLNDAIFKESVDKLLDEIGSVFGAKAMAEGRDFGVMMNCAENAADTLEVEIHSPGGSILDGYRIYQAIQELRGRGVHVTAIINSLAASMASVIAMAADTVKIVKGGRMMIHEASMGTWGNAEDHARHAKLLDEMSDEIASIYAERTGAETEEMRDRMRKETWMGAEECLKLGFVDEIVGKNEIDVNANKLQKRASNMSLLDKFLPNAELAEKLDGLTAELKKSECEILDLTNKVKEADRLIAEAAIELKSEKDAHLAVKADLATASAALADALKAIAPEATAERITAAITLFAEEETEANKSDKAATRPILDAVQAEVARQVALTGRAPLAVVDGKERELHSDTPHLDKIKALTGEERSAYYNANEAAIKAELSK